MVTLTLKIIGMIVVELVLLVATIVLFINVGNLQDTKETNHDSYVTMMWMNAITGTIGIIASLIYGGFIMGLMRKSTGAAYF